MTPTYHCYFAVAKGKFSYFVFSFSKYYVFYFALEKNKGKNLLFNLGSNN